MEQTTIDPKGLFAAMIAKNASDLFIKVGSPPAIRTGGKLQPVGTQTVTPQIAMQIYEEVTDDRLRKLFMEQSEVDTSYEVFGVGRFRVNIFKQRGQIGMVFRYVHSKVPTMDELQLPVEQLKKLVMLPRGLILVTGIAGSGKSTTIGSMLQYVNQTANKHIITVEDPIEYIFTDEKCVIDQREAGIDTATFATALKYCVRQSPDIIMIGEMRDRETVDAAISAAETGHLVISTLHSVNAYQTVERVINFFEPYMHQFIRDQLAMLLVGVLSQRLLPRMDGRGQAPATELMVLSPTVKELLHEGKTRELYKAIYEGMEYYGSHTFNQSLKRLYENSLISLENAMSAADNPEELKMELRGIVKGASTRDTSAFDSKIFKIGDSRISSGSSRPGGSGAADDAKTSKK
ncbi:MAG: PilT/PilU family type 4a pilus ATPase [Planctomycetes bacterium]|nr:PilT/PilU family type 4a pilus ATPase [Planctomycetota bacterium]